MLEHLIVSQIVATLAAMDALFSYLRGQYEKIVPRLFIVGVYLYLTATPDVDQQTRQFWVRWSISLLLFIDVLYAILRYIIHKIKGR